ETILSNYPDRLEKLFNDHEDAYVYDDAVRLLEACKKEGWQSGLLSGNVRKAAKIKLKRFGLWDSFEFGVFGDDARNREELVLVAEEAALGALGEPYTHNRMVLVGDTAQDAIAARANGVRSLIVCRRPESRIAIENANPTWLVDSLDEIERIILWLKAE
ncbi:MAG TPA: HAD hydrolase-like protein, partial [Candidatus Marinimicrobia bacterium]|nr:HAD hydrolase-like protein [Candidatus Neomarinimicrobiota bacterium]